MFWLSFYSSFGAWKIVGMTMTCNRCNNASSYSVSDFFKFQYHSALVHAILGAQGFQSAVTPMRHLVNYFRSKCFVNRSVKVLGRNSTLKLYKLVTPKGGWGCLVSPSCLEYQGWHFIPLSYLLSFLSLSLSLFFFFFFFLNPLVLLLFLSCHFSANGPFSWIFFLSGKLSNMFRLGLGFFVWLLWSS